MRSAARPVFFDHDGGIDDFVALLLLLSYDDVDLLGISVTPADTYIEAAVPATRKTLDLAGRTKVPVARGTLEGPNPFPHEFRVDSFKINDMPVLNQRSEVAAPMSPLPGEEFLARNLVEASAPVTLLMTGPLTNLARALDRYPGAERKVDELVLMGGALGVRGNVRQFGHDGSAEWNIYWDPAAAKRVWDSSIRITLFPLDATNQVPVTPELRAALGLQYRYEFSAAAGCFWALTSGRPYYCWDTLAAAYLARPDLCSFIEATCDVVTEGPSQGRTIPASGGRVVRAAEKVDAQAFYGHCVETLRR